MHPKFKEAINFHKNGELKKANDLCLKILRKEPNNFDILHLVGVIAFKNKNYQISSEFLKKAVKIKPDNAEVHNNLGIVLKKLNKFDDALKSCNQSIKIKPDFIQAYNNRGLILSELNQLDAALENYSKIITIYPNFAEAYARLAKHHLFMVWAGIDRSDDRRSKAKINIDKAMQLDPENPVVRISRGYYYYHGFRDYLRALEEFNYVQQKFPQNPAYHEHISYIERRLGRFKENIERLISVLKYDPQNPLLAINLAESYLYIDDFVNAEKYYRKGIMLAPDADLFYRDLAEVHYRKGDIKEAIKILDEGLEIITSDNLLVAKARLQFVARSYQKSLETLQPVTLNIYKQQTQYMPIETLKGMNYFYLGDKEKANEYLNKSKFILENELKNNSKDLLIHADYALVLAYLGRKDEAINSAEFATLMIPIKKDAIVGTLHFITLTKVLSIVGEHDKAIKNLELMRSVPAGPTLESLKIDPVWDSIRNSPEFKALIKEDVGKISS